MSHVIEQTEELADAIQQSKEYRSYKKLRSRMCEDAPLCGRVDDFCRQLFVLQSRPAQADDADRLWQLETDYNDILQNPLVVDYLSAKQALSELLRDVFYHIGQAVAFDLDFLAE